LLTLSSQYCFVVQDDEGVCGYAVATVDARSHYQQTKMTYLPVMCEKYPQPDKEQLSPADVRSLDIFTELLLLSSIYCILVIMDLKLALLLFFYKHKTRSCTLIIRKLQDLGFFYMLLKTSATHSTQISRIMNGIVHVLIGNIPYWSVVMKVSIQNSKSKKITCTCISICNNPLP